MSERMTASILWNAFPFAATAIAVMIMLPHADGQPSFYYLFLPHTAICLFPWFVTASYILRSLLTANRLGRPLRLGLMTPRQYRLASKTATWGKITLLTWLLSSLMVAAFFITCIKIERGQWGGHAFSQPATLSPGSSTYTLLTILDLTIRALFTVPLAAMAVAVFLLARSLLRRKKRQRKVWRVLPFICIAMFIIPILLIFVMGWRMRSVTREHIVAFLAKDSSMRNVVIGGQIAADPNGLISELTRVAPLAAHHSHATNKVTVVVRHDDGELTLEIGRDSSNPEEFWVFYPGFRHTRVNEIGRIMSELFKEYCPLSKQPPE